jgi:hypothetical protein
MEPLPGYPGQLAGDRLAIGRDRVGLPVIEVELRRGPDDLLRAGDVMDGRERCLDLVARGGVDLWLGEAERVNPRLHDLHGLVQIRLGDLRRSRTRLGLVDELHAAAQVQPELGLGREQRHKRRGQQAGDEK